MAQIAWSRPALLDLSRLHHFLQEKSPEAARRAVAAIRESTAVLVSHPAAGRPVDGLPPGIRDILVNFGAGGYVIRYRFDDNDVLILRIRHMREAGY
jgi:plasmid stabilization system protein ParE